MSNQKNEDELYISSVTPTIGVIEQRKLLEVTKNTMILLTKDEFAQIMYIYGKAIDRVLKENGIKEDNNETQNNE